MRTERPRIVHMAMTNMEILVERPLHAEWYEREIEVLASISRLLATQSGQQQMLTAVLGELERKLGMSRGTVMLLTEDEKELFVEAAQHIPSEQHQELRYRLGEGIVGSVIQSGQPAVIPQISHEPRFQNRIYQRPEQEDASFICVPITVGSEVVGTLSVDTPLQDLEFLEKPRGSWGSSPA